MADRPKRVITIREIEIDDLAPVFHLGGELFSSQDFPALYRTWDEYEVTGYFNTDPNLCLVAECQGRIVGFCLATTFEHERSPWTYGQIAWLAVEEGFQRQGIGRRLYREIEQRLRKEGVRMVMADTEEDNETAVAFFSRLGFAPRSTFLSMTKVLKKTGPRTGEKV